MVHHKALSPVWMAKRSELTLIELKKLAAGQVDLAAGYPNLKLPIWMEQIYNNQIGRQYSEEFGWQVGRLREIDDDLNDTVSSLLALDGKLARNMCVLPNGSTAINRVVASMALAGGRIVVSSPSFDVIAATVSEFLNCSLKVVSALSTNQFDVDRIIEAINAECVGIVLCSPDNPTGATLTENDIYRITEQAAKFGATVFIDQCFYFCGQSSVRPPLVANFAHPDSNWVMLWDTGKTIGLAQEKLAFLVSSDTAFPSILDRVRVVCFDTPFRTKRLFLEILQDVRIENYLAEFRDTIAQNREALETKLKEKGLVCYLPQTTSLALISLCDETAQYLSDRVHMVPLSAFSLTESTVPDTSDGWYRIALARDHGEFLRAINHIDGATSRNVPDS